jgi:cytochrome bd-type quinol oxidase subunit 2
LESKVNIPSQFNEKPQTKLGRWAVWLGIAFVVMFLINSLVFMPTSGSDAAWRHTLLPFYGIFMLLCGFVSGILGLIALLRGERSWAVCLTLVPALFVIFFLVGEFLLPH